MIDPGENSTGEEAPVDVDQEELVADIERTREQLGETVDALAAKLDFKRKARHRVEATRSRLDQKATRIQALSRRQPFIPAAAVAAVVVVSFVLIVWRRRR
jgi:hypothetical protein